ncbi:MAG TPA: hypothetical protein EYO33_32855 [Phycisphaerales bacterium]|nr:hypothetical protein [Phycisphaerales bacterium]
MSDQVSQFLGELAVEGNKDGETTGFTLSSEKAREKLKKFALEHPENYFLLVLASLHALGARNFSLRVDADDMEIEGDCRLERLGLKDLWSLVIGGHPSPQAAGLRVLALAMLTSVRFKKAVWTIDGKDDSGNYTFTQRIQGGVLADPVLEEAEIPVESLRISLKRKAVGQVASRFLSQLKNAFFQESLYEEKMLRERLFIGVFESFVFNQKPLDCRLEAGSALAVLRRGEAPEFLGARFLFEDQGEFPLVAVVYPKDSRAEAQVGEPATIHWLWHGLKMGTTDLGLSYKFARVFVVADELQTDLGFSSIAETWKRQAAIRQARDSIRSLLEFLVQEFTSSSLADPQHRDPRIEPILLETLAERIDVRRSRKRLASFNRSLIHCPLFWRSDPDGVDRRATLDELWERAEKGEPIYCFKDEMDWVAVPAWPDRPPVYRTGAEEYRILTKLFNNNLFREATQLAKKLSEIVAVQSQENASTTVHTVSDKVEPWFGSFLWRDCEVSWALKFPLSTSIKGRLRVLRSGKTFFEDDTLLLPRNLLLYGDLPVSPDYNGRLVEEERNEFFLPAITCLTEVLSRQGEVGPIEIEVSAILWELLAGDIRVWEGCPEIFETPWIVVGEPEEPLKLKSPAEVFTQERDCFYYNTPQAQAEGLESRHDVSTFVLPSHLEKALGESLKRPVHSVRGLELLRARPAFQIDGNSFHVIRFENDQATPWDSRLESIEVGIPHWRKVASSARDITLQQNLRGHNLQMRSVASPFSPLTVCLNWAEGMPDSRGLHFADKEQTERGRELAKEVALEAACVLFSESGVKKLLDYHSSTVENFWLELWLRGEEFSERPLFPRSDGTQVSYSEIFQTADHIHYFNDLENHKSYAEQTALWIPPALCREILELHPELKWRNVEGEAGFSKSSELPLESTIGRQSKTTREGEQPDSRTVTVTDLEPQKTPGAVETTESIEVSSVTAQKPHRPLPLEKSEDEPFEPAHQETAAPVQPEPPALIPSYVLGAGGAVQELIELTRSLGPIPFRDDFLAFLSSVEWDGDQTIPLNVFEGRVVLGKATSPTRESHLMMLSALFSIFNRKREDVLDLHEREFHALLLEHSLA